MAKFLGTPPINVFSGKVTDGQVKIGEETVLLADLPDQEVTVGIRPEGFVVDEDGTFSCALKGIEVLGRDISIVASHPAAENASIRAIVGSTRLNQDMTQAVFFSLKTDKVFLFDAKDGSRIETALKRPAGKKELTMKKQTLRAWLYLLPAILFLGFFLVYPLIDVFVYSMEEGYNFASQTYFGTGFYNYSYVLHDPYFLQAVKNTFLLVVITVPLSTGFALLISLALSSIKALRDLYQTVFFLPYVTNTLAVGMVFMVLFQKTEYTDGLINLMLHWFGAGPVDFISGPYWAKMFVLCFYTIWVVMPFKILILTSALASVNPDYYKAAKVDGTSKTRIFWKITVPMISPMIFYLIITGFIGAFKALQRRSCAVWNGFERGWMNTIVGYVYDMLYGDSGGFPSYASAAAILLFVIVLTITCINLLVSKKHVHY